MVWIEDTVVVDALPSDVFAVLTDPRHLVALSANTTLVAAPRNGRLASGSSFERVLWSHGIRNSQTVVVDEYDPDRLFVTRTRLIGFEVVYRYTLASAAVGATIVSLTKEATGGWPLLRPLVRHLLSRPEHDGGHLSRLRVLAEAEPIPFADAACRNASA